MTTSIPGDHLARLQAELKRTSDRIYELERRVTTRSKPRLALPELTDVSNTLSPTSGQVLSWDSTSRKWTASTPAGGGGSSTPLPLDRVQRHLWFYSTPNANTFNTIGVPTTLTTSGTLTNGDTADGPALNFATSATANTLAGIIPSTWTWTRADFEPEVLWVMQPVDLADIRFTCVLADNQTVNNGGGDPATNWVGFFYNSSVSANWRAGNNDGSGASTFTNTGVAATIARTFLRVKFIPGNAKFYIGDTLVAEHTTNLPASTQVLGPESRAQNLVAASKSFKWVRTGLSMKG